MSKPRDPRARVDWYEFRAAAEGGDTAELRVFGPIGGGFFVDEDAATAKNIARQLDELPDNVRTIRVLVNSPGGSVFDGIAIANALRRQSEEHGREVHVEVEALAASAATIITSAGDRISMPRNALLMVHNPFVLAEGDATAMRKIADVLDRVTNTIVATYRRVSKLTEGKLRQLMDETTWMEADEALANGFITDIAAPVKASAAAHFDALASVEIPERYRERALALFRGEVHEPAAVTSPEEPPTAGNDDPEEPPMSQKNEPKQTPEPAVEPTAIDAKQITAQERQRIDAIDAAGERFVALGLDADVVQASVKKHRADDSGTAEKVTAELLDKLAAQSDDTAPTGPAGPIQIGADERDKRITGLTAALMNRAGVSDTIRQAKQKQADRFADVATDPGEFRGLSLVDMARDQLERANPGSTRGKTRMQIAGDFLAAAGGSQTTSDFAVALENAMHKTLLAAYMIAPDTWRRFCAVGSVSDFRTHNRYRGAYLGSLPVVLEGGEFTRTTIPDAEKESISATTKGVLVSLSRQAIVNDDMQLFSRVARQLGRAAALSIETGVYTVLAENSGLGPSMADGNPLFDASHNNLGTGATLSVASIDADRVVMAQQTDDSGNEYLDLRPAIWVGPIGSGGKAREINAAEFDIDSGSNKMPRIPNRVRGIFEDIVDTARLSGTRYYLFADPQIETVLEVAFLEGQQEPFMEVQNGWTIDGVEWKVRHDFGIAAVGYRGALTNAGTT